MEEIKKEEEEKKLILEELKKKLEECQKLKDEYLAGWQRTRADFLNYKKDEMKRIEDFLRYIREEFVLKILPILDNFDLAEKKIQEDLKNNDNVKGILQIKKQFQDFLKGQGVEEIKSRGERFDPNFHEAVEEIEIKENSLTSSSQERSGIIVEEIQKGYKINSKLLRPAKVRVTK